ncbi:hypothetical protein [Chondromyces apiculatus]|uniref:Uncharacterized protein n=1 Tax=Chondromyces apiculatus DSM 436 TaxID=1192034 RepID=A0A017T1U5_9BACT|nr:hypothetical protein [Chondromyces apiculatus]EYF03198.1 Hypothetical protein CAP_5701 [Chondromyces apiculatus DSM 436]
MIVYGDAARSELPGVVLDRIGETLSEVAEMPGGIARHGALVSAFIEAGMLLQGVADLEATGRGEDARSPAQDGLMALLVALARGVMRSWEGGFGRGGRGEAEEGRGGTEGGLPEVESLRALLPEGRVTLKLPEGYAYYAVYPEGYAEAAKGMVVEAPVRVIGIRSIGTGLAAMVAAALGAPLPVTVRPGGHPFRRELRVAEALSEALTSEAGTAEAGTAEAGTAEAGTAEAGTAKGGGTFAVVDEGPGLSGSSFGAVADHLEARGVARGRVVFFPSHDNPLGPEAREEHRERWEAAERRFVGFEALVRAAREPWKRLEGWVEDLTGEATAPLQDVAGGRWRAERYGSVAAWPAAHLAQERRKYLLRSAQGVFLLKFAGLGPEGARKLGLLRRLHEAGLTPEPLGLRHGFLVERWVGEARALDTRDTAAHGQEKLLEAVGRYLGFRSRQLAATEEEGASCRSLLEMAVHNTRLALGEEAAAAVERWEGRVEALARQVRRVVTDNRMHAAEWLVLGDGRLLKADAVDHHASHDLVGCQSIAWDIAGATVELGLGTAEEAEALRESVEKHAGHAVGASLVSFNRVCYLAFQIGYATMAAQALGWDQEEQRRFRVMCTDYQHKLLREISSGVSQHAG